MQLLRSLLGIFLFCYFAHPSKAQNNDQRAQSAYLSAENSFDAGQYTNAANNLYRAKEYLGRSNPVIQYLLIKSLYMDKKYSQARRELSEYFRLVRGNEQSEGAKYKEMLTLVDEMDSTISSNNRLVTEARNIAGHYKQAPGGQSCPSYFPRSLEVKQYNNQVTVLFDSGFWEGSTKDHDATLKSTFTFNLQIDDKSDKSIYLFGSETAKVTLEQKDFGLYQVFDLPLSYTYNVVEKYGNIVKEINISLPCLTAENVHKNGKITGPQIEDRAHGLSMNYSQEIPK